MEVHFIELSKKKKKINSKGIVLFNLKFIRDISMVQGVTSVGILLWSSPPDYRHYAHITYSSTDRLGYALRAINTTHFAALISNSKSLMPLFYIPYCEKK